MIKKRNEFTERTTSMRELEGELLEVIKAAVKNAGYDETFAAVKISDRPDLCEYQCNTALPLAKRFKEKPMDIADKISKELENADIIKNISIAAPGFINFDISEEFLTKYLTELHKKDKLCIPDAAPKKIVIDYGGPNVAKALHIGHLRSAIIGEAIKRIALELGHEVTADVHLGDYGLQMGLIINELKHTKPELPYFKPDFTCEKYVGEIKQPPFTVQELGLIYPTATLKSKNDEGYYNEALQATKLLQEGNEAYQAIFRHIVDVSIPDLKRSYDRLSVSFDLWLGESDAKPYIAPMIDRLKSEGYARTDNNALVIDVALPDDKKEIPPCLIQKSDGSALYATTDLATLVQRRQDYDMDRVIYVVDKRQDLHFTQVFRAAKKCGIIRQDTELDFVGFGTICGKDGSPLKTRDGGTVSLESLLDDTRDIMKAKINDESLTEEEINTRAEMIAMSAIKYGDLSNQPSKDYIYDANKFTSYEGNTGPYILYSVVRINSILDKCTELSPNPEFKLNTELKPVEKALMLSLSRYSAVVNQAFRELTPNKLCAYLYEVAEGFNRLYHDIRIISEPDDKLKNGYISLLVLTKRILVSALDLLAISSPDRM